MPVRWSSTYLMLDHAEKLKDDVDTFDLQLTDEEWTRVSMLLGLLAKAKYAQQSFSSDCGPATHLALPALEALHKVWHTRTMKVEYAGFRPTLEAGINKITSYYKKTADSNAYIMAMLLDPVQKANHIHKYWGADVYEDAMKHAETLYKERYFKLNGAIATKPIKPIKNTVAYRKVKQLLRELSEDEDEDEDMPVPSLMHGDPQ
ncbi:hypothetical protein OG21DRAFT_1491932 [Imleria badia]|nr:hypothetical protein OG21DRAFT_1491932 [Imleria badia]